MQSCDCPCTQHILDAEANVQANNDKPSQSQAKQLNCGLNCPPQFCAVSVVINACMQANTDMVAAGHVVLYSLQSKARLNGTPLLASAPTSLCR